MVPELKNSVEKWVGESFFVYTEKGLKCKNIINIEICWHSLKYVFYQWLTFK